MNEINKHLQVVYDLMMSCMQYMPLLFGAALYGAAVFWQLWAYGFMLHGWAVAASIILILATFVCVVFTGYTLEQDPVIKRHLIIPAAHVLVALLMLGFMVSKTSVSPNDTVLYRTENGFVLAPQSGKNTSDYPFWQRSQLFIVPDTLGHKVYKLTIPPSAGKPETSIRVDFYYLWSNASVLADANSAASAMPAHAMPDYKNIAQTEVAKVITDWANSPPDKVTIADLKALNDNIRATLCRRIGTTKCPVTISSYIKYQDGHGNSLGFRDDGSGKDIDINS